MTTIAIIGCGRIVNNAHLPQLSDFEDVRIKYVCDIIEEKAIAAKNNFPGIENVITDYKIAISDPEVEAVFVFTPNYAHYTITIDALRAGKASISFNGAWAQNPDKSDMCIDFLGDKDGVQCSIIRLTLIFLNIYLLL